MARFCAVLAAQRAQRQSLLCIARIRGRLGSRRGAVRLYSDFAQSDVVVASPLALATFLSETAGKDGGGADFLSSIEVVVMERADALLMQNWAHVTTGPPPFSRTYFTDARRPLVEQLAILRQK